MKKLIIATLFLSLAPLLLSQDIDSLRRHKYRLKVEIIGSDQVPKSLLLETKESSIEIVNHPFAPVEKYEIDIRTIESLKFYDKNRVVKGPIIGALSGFTVGASIGLISGDDPGGAIIGGWKAEEKAILFGGLLSIPGTIVGGIVGSTVRVKIKINGNIKTYNENIKKIRKYEYPGKHNNR